jgi:hypothetical protein
MDRDVARPTGGGGESREGHSDFPRHKHFVKFVFLFIYKYILAINISKGGAAPTLYTANSVLEPSELQNLVKF